MVLTAAQVTVFLESLIQMAITREVRIQLKSEGVEMSEDLVGFYEESISKISDNLRRLGGRVPYLTPGDITGATIPTLHFTFGAKSQVRLVAAYHLIRFVRQLVEMFHPPTFAGRCY